jgi:hypothetical protein
LQLASGVSPTLLTNHPVAWLRLSPDGLATFKRHLLGIEHMFQLGLPADVRGSPARSDAQLRALAGNSMSVPWLVNLLTAVFAVVEFGTPCSTAVRQSGRSANPDAQTHHFHPLPGTSFCALTKRALPGLESRSSDHKVTIAQLTALEMPRVPRQPICLRGADAVVACAADAELGMWRNHEAAATSSPPRGAWGEWRRTACQML